MQHQQLDHKEVKQKFSAITDLVAPPMVIIANNIKDSRNMGALFRLADAAGISRIFTYGFSAHNQDKIRRVACATQRHVQLQVLKGADELASLQEQFELIALEITSDSIPYTKYQPEKAVAIVIGNEKDGISAEVLKRVDHSLHIPMYGQGSSMNVAMATGIAIYGILPNLPDVKLPFV